MRDRNSNLWSLLREALTLDPNFYEHIPINAKNRRFAQIVVVLAAISYSFGSAVIFLINRVPLPSLILRLLGSGIGVVIGYYFWTLTIWKIGDWFKRDRVTFRALMIPLGLAYAPQALNFLTLIPLLGQPIERVLAVWSLLAAIIAVRQGLDISSGWAIAICLIGWIPLQMTIGLVRAIA
ncbi:hypothetical protein [Chroococcidiopsis sp.]|uniref:hypothetical protein n=1 Tax=Chroococcidiopsis sp. TaxID=3088168 RepID=UPI003F2E8518